MGGLIEVSIPPLVPWLRELPADGQAELIFRQAVQVLLGEATFAEEVSEDEREHGIAVVVEAVDVCCAAGSGTVPNPRVGKAG